VVDQKVRGAETVKGTGWRDTKAALLDRCINLWVQRCLPHEDIESMKHRVMPHSALIANSSATGGLHSGAVLDGGNIPERRKEPRLVLVVGGGEGDELEQHKTRAAPCPPLGCRG
jgi:hypothetical protein